jgi:hypothetical protein
VSGADTDYGRFVATTWDRIEERVGRLPIYLDARRIATTCPACLDGTVALRFVEQPRPIGEARPAFVAYSPRGRGCCSNGCDEAAIGRALA